MLGICCHYIKEETRPKSGEKYFVNEMDERSLQLGRYRSGKYTSDQIKGTYVNNVRRLGEMLPKIRKAGIKLFRISSAMFPLADQVDKSLWDNKEITDILSNIGTFVKQNDMRVTTHPGQFCVLSSDSDEVVEKAFVELSIHGWLFDKMGLEHSPKYAINIHGGKKDRGSRLIEQIKSLPDNVRKRLTLENDETTYNVIDLLPVFQETGVPIVLDSHHASFNDGCLTLEEAFEVTKETWPTNVKPLQHISNTSPENINANFQLRRKHSNMIHYVPAVQLKALQEDLIDAEIEAKFKNVAVFSMAKTFNIPL
jgi:UV DNA damage endonuclease